MLKKLTATLAVVIGFGVHASFALADNSTSNCPDQSATPTACVVSSGTTATVTGAKASASDIATGKVVVVADDSIRAGVDLRSPRCHWTKGQWSNSFKSLNGKRVWYYESVRGFLCPSTKSPTGWVKIKGGKTGRRCYNPAKEGVAPGPVITGEVLMVRSFVSVRVRIDAHVTIRVVAICGWAQADAKSWVIIALRQYVRAKGNTDGGLFAHLTVNATANASAGLTCVTTPPPPPPPPPPPGCTSNCNPPLPPPPPPPPPPPVRHTCSLTIGNAGKGDAETASASVSADSSANIVVNWGDGQVGGPGTHTYPTPTPSSNAGDGVTYTISASATFSDGQTISCGSGRFFVPAPPPSGNTDPPPPPPT